MVVVVPEQPERLATVMVTVVPGLDRHPAVGALGLDEPVLGRVVGRLADHHRVEVRRSAASTPACVWVSPTTSGTRTVDGPLDTTRFTVALAGSWRPAAGFVLITSFLGTVDEAWMVMVPHWNPAWPRRLHAVVWSRPVTSGTGGRRSTAVKMLTVPPGRMV